MRQENTKKIATTKERILQFVDYMKISKQLFYSETGLKRGVLDGDKLKSSIPDTFIASIIARYPELNVIWLLTGEGEMLNSPKKTNQTDTSDQCDENNIYRIKYYEILDKLVSVQEQLSKTQERLIESQQNFYKLQQELEQLKDQGGNIVVGA